MKATQVFMEWLKEQGHTEAEWKKWARSTRSEFHLRYEYALAEIELMKHCGEVLTRQIEAR